MDHFRLMIHSEQAVSLTVSHTGTFKWKLLASSYLTCNLHAFDTHPIHILYLITTPWLSQDLNALTLFFFFFLNCFRFPIYFFKKLEVSYFTVLCFCCTTTSISCTYTYIISFFVFTSSLGHPRVLSRVHVLQEILFSLFILFYAAAAAAESLQSCLTLCEPREVASPFILRHSLPLHILSLFVPLFLSFLGSSFPPVGH